MTTTYLQLQQSLWQQWQGYQHMIQLLDIPFLRLSLCCQWHRILEQSFYSGLRFSLR